MWTLENSFGASKASLIHFFSSRLRTFSNEVSGPNASNSLSIFEKSKAQENVSIHSSTGARRLVAMLRVLQMVQTLLQQDKHSTKRDLYYTDPGLLKNQATVDQALADLCIRLNCSRSSLHVDSVSRGLVMGALRFKEAGRVRDCSVSKTRGFTVPTDPKQVTGIRVLFFVVAAPCFLLTSTELSSPAQFILVVEKETVFHRLANDGFCVKNHCIVITGKGYPDISTRSFLKLLVAVLGIPVYGLVDSDPYGVDILATYRFGSLTMTHDAEALATPSIRWLGVLVTDCHSYNAVCFH